MRELRTWTEYLIERFASDKEEAIDFLHAVMEEYQIYGNSAAVVGALHTVVTSQGGISEFAKKINIEPQVLSEILSSDEAPRIDTLRTILNAFGCRLSIETVKAVNNSLKDVATASEESADLAYELDEHRAVYGLVHRTCRKTKESNVNSNTIHILNTGTELFVDDALIASKHNVTRTLHQCVKHDVSVLKPDPTNPWEHGGPDQSRRVHLYGTTMYDAAYGKYRMWYMCRMGPHWRFKANEIPGLYVPRPDRNPSTYRGKTHDVYGRKFVENDRGDLTCYAESDDGLTWTKPNLGLFEFNGNPNNNIVWDLHGACVFRDDDEPDPQRRYKMIGFCRRYRNIFLLMSPDGIRWDDSDYLEPIADRENEGAFNVIYDNKTEMFRAYALIRGNDKDARRMIAYTESPRLEGPWKPLEPMFGATDKDDAVGVQRYGADRAEIHNMSGFRYHNIYIGIPGVLYVTGPGAAEHEIPIDGPIDAQLVSSRDGFNWAYPDSDRTPIIPRGESGTFDTGMIMGTAIEPIITDAEIHWYYTGTVHTHGAQMKDRHKEIGLAKWRLDGFVSLDADAGGGIVETLPLQIPNGRLEINADASNGQIGVEVLTADGQVQHGFSMDDCMPLTNDDIRHSVQWKSATLADAAQPLRLRFVLNRAKLYAFRVGVNS